MKPASHNVSLKPVIGDSRYFVLRIALDEIKPLIWRRLVVPASITLDQLHDVLQVVMGWEDYHLHNFTFGERRYTEEPEEPEEGEDEWGVVLGQLISKVKTKFHYAYDFGDGWQHTITVERISNIPALVASGRAHRRMWADLGGMPNTSRQWPVAGIPIMRR